MLIVLWRNWGFYIIFKRQFLLWPKAVTENRKDSPPLQQRMVKQARLCALQMTSWASACSRWSFHHCNRSTTGATPVEAAKISWELSLQSILAGNELQQGSQSSRRLAEGKSPTLLGTKSLAALNAETASPKTMPMKLLRKVVKASLLDNMRCWARKELGNHSICVWIASNLNWMEDDLKCFFIAACY